MELKIKIQGKTATIKGTRREIKKMINDLNQDQDEVDNLIKKVPLPSVNDVMEFIEKNPPDFRHSMSDIFQKFFGDDMKIRKNRKIYDLIFRTAKEARTIIEENHNGSFISTKESPPSDSKYSFQKITVYRFVPKPKENNN